MGRKNSPRGLGVVAKGKKFFLFSSVSSPRKTVLRLDGSTNGLEFSQTSLIPKIKLPQNKKEKIDQYSDFKISKLDRHHFFLTYKLKKKKGTILCGALSQDLVNWRKLGEIDMVKESGMVVPQCRYHGNHILFYGEKSIKIAFSANLVDWEVFLKPLLPVNDGQNLEVGGVVTLKEGIFLFYYQEEKKGKRRQHAVRLALFDKDNPTRLLKDFPKSIWQQPEDWLGKKVRPVGLVKRGKTLFTYWQIENEEIFVVKLSPFQPDGLVRQTKTFHFLKRFKKNPILQPLVDHLWESQAVFNPAAVWDEEKVHLIYRAVGDKAVSVFGYAASKDGLSLDERAKKPIYTPREPFETNLEAPICPADYLSGPGCGGCEDPRITKIDGRFYLTYNAWNGYDPPRVALTSIAEEDFRHQRWNWKKSVLLSNPDSSQVKNDDKINKNWAIFPEKINGKYAILHSLCPIQVDYFDSLDFDGKTYIDSYREWKMRKNSWDTFIRGAGPPPMKTKDGWLLLYHATTSDCGYKMGAMLLKDSKPTKILCRSRAPILEPEAWYETEGIKPRIVYGCGAVIVNGTLLVYYGGSDTVACVASAPIDKFLTEIKTTGLPKLQPMKSQIEPVYRR